MATPRETLVILGASVRAAVFSARRAGFAPLCGDLFADVDLRRAAPAVAVKDYPAGLAEVARAAPPGAWMYTGRLENHPGLVGQIAAARPLLGNSAEVLRTVRDPMRLVRAFQAAGIACPAVSLVPTGLPTDGSWLCKPVHGSAGIGIRAWHGETDAGKGGQAAHGTHFFQQRIHGESYSGVYVAAAGRAVLLGITRQLVGVPWTGAGPFQYAGSIGPIDLGDDGRGQFERIGEELSRRFGLTGLFGVDTVVSGGTVWPIEVNPRYPASIEVLERALGIETMRLHVDACRNAILPDAVPRAARAACGKAVVYAKADLVVPPAFERFAERLMAVPDWPDLADIPAAGTSIRAGLPVTTVLAEAADEDSVEAILQQRAQEVEQRLYPNGP